MAESFDPYHKWLGIPPKDQPPDYYRLLALPLFESGRQVISHAADQRLAHVRKFLSGEHGALAARISDEITEARICLLSPKRKQLYDELLRQMPTAIAPMASNRPARGSDSRAVPAGPEEKRRPRRSLWFHFVCGPLRGIEVRKTLVTLFDGIARRILFAPRSIDRLLLLLAGEGNTILHNFFRCLAIAAVVIASVVLVRNIFF